MAAMHSSKGRLASKAATTRANSSLCLDRIACACTADHRMWFCACSGVSAGSTAFNSSYNSFTWQGDEGVGGKMRRGGNEKEENATPKLPQYFFKNNFSFLQRSGSVQS